LLISSNKPVKIKDSSYLYVRTPLPLFSFFSLVVFAFVIDKMTSAHILFFLFFFFLLSCIQETIVYGSVPPPGQLEYNRYDFAFSYQGCNTSQSSNSGLVMSDYITPNLNDCVFFTRFQLTLHNDITRKNDNVVTSPYTIVQFPYIQYLPPQSDTFVSYFDYSYKKPTRPPPPSILDDSLGKIQTVTDTPPYVLKVHLGPTIVKWKLTETAIPIPWRYDIRIRRAATYSSSTNLDKKYKLRMVSGAMSGDVGPVTSSRLRNVLCRFNPYALFHVYANTSFDMDDGAVQYTTSRCENSGDSNRNKTVTTIKIVKDFPATESESISVDELFLGDSDTRYGKHPADSPCQFIGCVAKDDPNDISLVIDVQTVVWPQCVMYRISSSPVIQQKAVFVLSPYGIGEGGGDSDSLTYKIVVDDLYSTTPSKIRILPNGTSTGTLYTQSGQVFYTNRTGIDWRLTMTHAMPYPDSDIVDVMFPGVADGAIIECSGIVPFVESLGVDQRLANLTNATDIETIRALIVENLGIAAGTPVHLEKNPNGTNTNNSAIWFFVPSGAVESLMGDHPSDRTKGLAAGSAVYSSDIHGRMLDLLKNSGSDICNDLNIVLNSQEASDAKYSPQKPMLTIADLASYLLAHEFPAIGGACSIANRMVTSLDKKSLVDPREPFGNPLSTVPYYKITNEETVDDARRGKRGLIIPQYATVFEQSGLLPDTIRDIVQSPQYVENWITDLLVPNSGSPYGDYPFAIPSLYAPDDDVDTDVHYQWNGLFDVYTYNWIRIGDSLYHPITSHATNFTDQIYSSLFLDTSSTFLMDIGSQIVSYASYTYEIFFGSPLTCQFLPTIYQDSDNVSVAYGFINATVKSPPSTWLSSRPGNVSTNYHIVYVCDADIVKFVGYTNSSGQWNVDDNSAYESQNITIISSVPPSGSDKTSAEFAIYGIEYSDLKSDKYRTATGLGFACIVYLYQENLMQSEEEEGDNDTSTTRRGIPFLDKNKTDPSSSPGLIETEIVYCGITNKAMCTAYGVWCPPHQGLWGTFEGKIIFIIAGLAVLFVLATICLSAQDTGYSNIKMKIE
jgi:hypothetical protein